MPRASLALVVADTSRSDGDFAAALTSEHPQGLTDNRIVLDSFAATIAKHQQGVGNLLLRRLRRWVCRCGHRLLSSEARHFVF